MTPMRHSIIPLLCLGALWSGQALAAETSLKNPGFEEKLDEWSLHVYGAPAAAESDEQIKHEGARSLRISATDLSDAALGQDIQVVPKQWYRFTGWVRTRDLKPSDASVYGTFQIQRPGGKGIIAGGDNHQGDTDWTAVPIIFRSPADGQIRIAPFFAGFGKGTGTVWFDDLSLEEIDVSKAPVRLTREPLTTASISPYQYGQFIEYLCDLVPSMWAERLYDGSFEGLSPYKVAYLKQTDFREKPWYPSGQTNRAEYVLDPTNPVSGNVSQKIDATAGNTPCTVGISQDGIWVEQGKPCVFSCYLRQENIEAPVEIKLRRDGNVYATTTFQPDATWKKYTGRLIPAGTDDHTTLSITFQGPGRLWIDNASLMPEDSAGRWRRDVVEALAALRPGIIRFGGSAIDIPDFGDFEWRDTIGDSDHRKPFRAWGGLQPTGPGLEEIVQLCARVKAEPLICVRTVGRSAKDAADQVEYFNGAVHTPMGRLRAKNGHADPYRIKFWQIGNERSGPEYDAQLKPFCAAMRAVDPGIKLLSSYPTPGVLRQAGDLLDYVSPHQYDCMNLAATEAQLLSTSALLRQLAPARPIRLAVTEWNTTAGDFGPGRAKLWTLENALAVARYHNLLHRHCDLVEIANRSNLCNSFCSGIIQTDNHRLYKTPAYYAQQLYATLAGSRALKIESMLPANAAPDLSTTVSADGALITLFAVNDTSEDITRPLDLSAFGDNVFKLSTWTLADRDKAGQPDATNTFADPERISATRSIATATSPRFVQRFPALSLMAIQFAAQQPR